MGIQNLIGRRLGQYELRELLGAGGMGAVYRGYQTNLKRYVAVKVMSGDIAQQPGYTDRFIREAETSAALSHPNIIHIIDFGMQQGISYLVMELLTGGTLSERITQRSNTDDPLPSLGEVAGLLAQLGSALDYAHSEGVIHRDIKPSNVMFDNHGNAYLVDFGIAKLASATQSLTASGLVIGTWGYMAPEQWRADELTAATDEYALAVMTYSLVTGQMPFEAATPAHVMHKHMNEMPTPPHSVRPDVPESVTQVLERALAKDAADRFPTCTAFAQTFGGAIHGNIGPNTAFFTASMRRNPTAAPSAIFTPSGGSGSPLVAPATADRSIYKHPLMWLATAVILLLAATLVFLAIGDDDNQGNLTPTVAAQPAATPTMESPLMILSPQSFTATDVLVTDTAIPTKTPTLRPTATPQAVVIIPSDTVTPTATLTPTYTNTASPTPTDTPTSDMTATLEAEMAPLWTETYQAALTTTALAWTNTPTPDLEATTAAMLATTQAAADTQATHNAQASATQAALDLTATATLWTATPTVTPTLTVTPTHTASATPTLTATPTSTPSNTSTLTLTVTAVPTSTLTPTVTSTGTSGFTSTSISDSTAVEPCTLETTQSGVSVRVGPGENRAVRAALPAYESIEVVGKTWDNEENLWWQIHPPGYSEAEADRYWVSDEYVATVGDCKTVPTVGASPVLFGSPINAEEEPASTSGSNSSQSTTSTGANSGGTVVEFLVENCSGYRADRSDDLKFCASPGTHGTIVGVQAGGNSYLVSAIVNDIDVLFVWVPLSNIRIIG